MEFYTQDTIWLLELKALHLHPGNQVEGEKGRGKTSLLTSKGRSLEAVICFQKAAKKVGPNCFILESPMVNKEDGKNAYLETTISFTHSH